MSPDTKNEFRIIARDIFVSAAILSMALATVTLAYLIIER
jgi:hypothetical protein